MSVIIPTYNQDGFINKCIESVVTQSHPNVEIIVVDDVSTDNTAFLIKKWQKKDNRIMSVRNSQNLGATGSRNVGIKASSGEYIAFLDSDDFWHKNKLKLQLEKFKNPRVGLVYCSATVVDETGKKIGSDEASWRGNIFIRLTGAMRIIGSNSSVLIRRSVLDRVGIFNPSLPYTGDWDLWLKISKEYHVDFVSSQLTFTRRHGKSLGTNTKKFTLNHLRFFLLLPKLILNHEGLSWKQKIVCFRQLIANFSSQLKLLLRIYRNELVTFLAKKIPKFET